LITHASRFPGRHCLVRPRGFIGGLSCVRHRWSSLQTGQWSCNEGPLADLGCIHYVRVSSASAFHLKQTLRFSAPQTFQEQSSSSTPK
jgi:hypothetical protein